MNIKKMSIDEIATLIDETNACLRNEEKEYDKHYFQNEAEEAENSKWLCVAYSGYISVLTKIREFLVFEKKFDAVLSESDNNKQFVEACKLIGNITKEDKVDIMYVCVLGSLVRPKIEEELSEKQRALIKETLVSLF
jgi:hypothetical protein